MASTISSSSDRGDRAAGAATPRRRAFSPSAGAPMASDLAIVSGRTGRTVSAPAAHAVRHRRAADGLRAEGGRSSVAVDEARLQQVAVAPVELGEQRAGRDRRDGLRRQAPAELLGRLVGQRLRALRVVRPQVHVHERPRPVVGELGAEAIDVVVVAVDREHARARNGRRR